MQQNTRARKRIPARAHATQRAELGSGFLQIGIGPLASSDTATWSDEPAKIILLERAIRVCGFSNQTLRCARVRRMRPRAPAPPIPSKAIEVGSGNACVVTRTEKEPIPPPTAGGVTELSERTNDAPPNRRFDRRQSKILWQTV